MKRRTIIPIIAAVALIAAPAWADHAPEPAVALVSVDDTGLAIGGYDPVAYFTLGRAQKGNPRFVSAYRGAVYHFASQEHLELFAADPEKYVPQFGGHCAYAASINRLASADPTRWEIVDSRLLLQKNRRAWDLWHEMPTQCLANADASWPSLVSAHAKPIKRLVSVDGEGLAIEGYDPVAYFTDGKAVKGAAPFTATHDGATYRFVSPEHKAMFESSPEAYTPLFGGYCGYAASINRVSTADPTIWQIVSGRLVLQNSQKAYRLFNEDVQISYNKARQHWPHLIHAKGK